MGMESLRTVPKLREFGLEADWARESACALGPNALTFWGYGRWTSLLDKGPAMDDMQRALLDNIVSLNFFNARLIWIATGPSQALRNRSLDRDKNHMQVYRSTRDAPCRIRGGIWRQGDFRFSLATVKGSWGHLVDSRLASVTQKDVTDEYGVKVRYMSDPGNEIDERINPKNHHWALGPRHANAIRLILYWKRRYAPIPILLCERDVKEASKLIPAACLGLNHMGVRFANYIIIYRSLFLLVGSHRRRRGG